MSSTEAASSRSEAPQRARPCSAQHDGTGEGARGLLDGLKSDQRRALLLRAAGYSYREIATHRSWTYSKVDRCVRRDRATLRELPVG